MNSSHKPVNIYVIAFIHLGIDGSTTHLLEKWARVANSDKYQVNLFLPDTADSIKEKYSSYLKDITVHWVPRTMYSKNIARYALSMIAYEYYIFKRLFRDRIEFDIIYERYRWLGLGPMISLALNKSKNIIELNGIVKYEKPSNNIIFDFISSMNSIIERIRFPQADKAITVTDMIGVFFVSKGFLRKEDVITIPNGVDTKRFSLVREADSIALKQEILKRHAPQFLSYLGNNPLETLKILIFVGKLIPWQGIEHIIEAAPSVVNEVDSARFLIIGDGPESDRLKELVKMKGLHDKFAFTGAIDYRDIPKYINIGDICIAYKEPAQSGCSPLKVYEYMSCGKPVIASRVKGLEFIEEQKAGLLVKPCSPIDLANAIIALLKDKKTCEEFGKNARNLVISLNDWDMITNRVIDVLEKISS